MTTQRSRQRGPYDLQITYSGTSQEFMLVRDPQSGELLYKSGFLEEIVQQQRTDAFSYEHRDPRVDIPASFEDFSLGAGFEDAPDTGAAGFRGYNYTQGVDLSWGTSGYLSPLVQSAGSALTTTGAKKFLLSSLGLFAINDRYVNRWNGSAWTQPLDAGAGGMINDIFEFSNATATYVVAGLRGGSYYYSTNGTTWTISEAEPTAPGFRSVSTATTASATTLTPAEPVGAAENDILILSATHVTTSFNITMADTSFWNLIAANSPAATADGRTYWGRRGAGAPNYQVNFNETAAGTVVVAAYSGIATTGSPLDVIGAVTAVNPQNTAHVSAAVTTTGANRLVIGSVIMPGSSGTVAPHAGTTERADVDSANGSIELFEIAAAAAGAYGAYTSTSTNTVYSGTVLFALKPAAWTGANNVSRWAARGQSSGAPVLWAINGAGNIRNATTVVTPGSWSAADAIQVGQRSATQLGLEVIDNEFFLFHDGGITSYDGTTVSTVFASPFADPPSDAARPVTGYDNRVYHTFGSSLLQFDASTNKDTKIWPRGLQEGNAELNGTITAIAASEKYIYFAVKNSAGNYYIMRLDPSTTVSVGGETIYPAHTIAYRGANAVTALAYIKASADALSSTNPTLMLTSGLTASYIVLPRPGLRPEDDSNYRFDTTADRTAFGSFVNFRAQGFPKWLVRGDIEAKTTTTETIALQYQVPAGTATALVTANTAQTGRTTAALTTPVTFTRVRYKAIFNTGANTASPALRGLVMHAAPNAPRDRGFVFTVRLRDNQPTNHTGVTSRYQAANQDAFLFAAVNQIVTLRDPFGSSYTTKVLNIQPVRVSYVKNGSVEEWLQVTLGQLTA